MRLSRPTILREIKKNRLVFNPPIGNTQISASAIDLRLGTVFIHLDKTVKELANAGGDIRWYAQETPWKQFEDRFGRREEIRPDGQIELPPRKLLLGFVMEYIKLPPTLAGRVEGKSSIARRGLLVHLTAPTIQAGWEGNLQLEMYNVGPVPLLLKPGLPICQLILEQVTDPIRDTGQFQMQTQHKTK